MKRSLLLSTIAAFSCGALSHGAVIHLWDFNEASGNAVIDSIGGQNGSIIGDGASRISGQVSLPGGSSATAPYIDLPNNLISPLTNTTLEGWVTPQGTQSWARVFDFGSSVGGELSAPGGGGDGLDYIILSFNRGTNANQQRVELRNEDPATGAGQSTIDSDIGQIIGEEFHFAVTFEAGAADGGANLVSHYRNGDLVASGPTEINLSDLNDVNNWLGRSNWVNDANAHADYNEFRIHDAALSASEVSSSFATGPTPIPEPSLPAFIALGMVAFIVRRRRR